MPEAREHLEGGRLLTELSAAMVTMFRDFLGKGPEHCKAHWAGSDTLMIMLARRLHDRRADAVRRGTR